MEINTNIFDQPTRDFHTHLQEDNFRILFSGIYGIGKTTFLKYFFDQKFQSESMEGIKYETIFLTPVNYSICNNEDIFKYIKADILCDLCNR